MPSWGCSGTNTPKEENNRLAADLVPDPLVSLGLFLYHLDTY